MRYLAPGTPVQTVMGVRLRGKVVNRLAKRYTDGQCREPEPHERPVYVQWEDGTYGWISRACLKEV
jgi:hypothetical protein